MRRIDAALGLAAALLVGGLAAAAAARARALSDSEHSALHLKRIGEGLEAYRAAFGFWPSNGGRPAETQSTPNVCTGFPTMGAYRWGYGEPGRAGRLQTGCWAYAILPFVGEEEAYRKGDYKRAVPIYYLPARREAVAQHVPARDPYYKDWFYLDDGLGPWGRTDYAGNDQVIRPGMGRVMKAEEVRDGLGETILVAEKAVDDRAVKAGVFYWDEPIILGGSGGTGRKGKFLHRDGPILEDAADNWGSPDEAGVQFLFADGHVHGLSYKTPSNVMGALISPNRNDDADYEKYLLP
jgi:prepilin-type processing-associated H-X9-DG protein